MIKSSKKSSAPPPNPNNVPTTPDGKKRCQHCEQVFPLKKSTCPHCKKTYSGALSEVAPQGLTEQEWIAFDEKAKRLRKSKSASSRAELITLLFETAMAIRYTLPNRSMELFLEVVTLDPENFEARIKVSWFRIKQKDFLSFVTLLEPVVHPDSHATPEQRQRAYNNLVCSYMFRFPPDYSAAEKLARAGIAVDEKGSVKLWENLGIILKETGRYSEARDAFAFALTIDPQSDYAAKILPYLNKGKFKKDKEKKFREGVVLKENNSNNNNINNINNNINNKETYELSLKKRKSSKHLTVERC